MVDVTQNYQCHKNAFLSHLGSAIELYGHDAAAGFALDGKLFNDLSDSLAKQGPVRLYKYQPYSERNLTDCKKGVLHLSRLTDLNDINEGSHFFDKDKVVRMLTHVDLEQSPKEILKSAPPFLSGLVDEEFLSQFQKT